MQGNVTTQQAAAEFEYEKGLMHAQMHTHMHTCTHVYLQTR